MEAPPNLPEVLTLDLSDAAFEDWVDRRLAAILAMRPEEQDKSPRGMRLALSEPIVPDRRSREDYLADVESHLESCRRAVKEGVLQEAAARRLNEITLSVRNPTAKFVADVELVLRIDARALAFQGDVDDDSDWALPRPPRAFGSPEPRLVRGASKLYTPFRLPRLRGNRSVDIDNGPPLVVKLHLGALRPHAVRPTSPFVLVLAEEPSSNLSIGWSATSSNVDGLIEGTLSLPLSARALRPVELVPYDVERPDAQS